MPADSVPSMNFITSFWHAKKSQPLLETSAQLVACRFVNPSSTSPYDAECFSLMNSFSSSFLSCLSESIKSLGFDFHRLGILPKYGRCHQSCYETATSTQMRTSYSFAKWRSLLIDLGIVIGDFVLEETKDGMPLARRGWTAKSLLTLFSYQFQPIDLTNAFSKSALSNTPYSTFGRYIEGWWCENVERIRRGLKPLTQPEKVEMVCYSPFLKGLQGGLELKSCIYSEIFRVYGRECISGFDSRREAYSSWSAQVDGKMTQFIISLELNWAKIDWGSYLHRRDRTNLSG